MKKLILLSIAFIGCKTQKSISFSTQINKFDSDVSFYHHRTGLKYSTAIKLNDSTIFVIMK